MKNKHPIYIISKGRADTRMTVKALEEINVDFHVVIEPQEFDDYAAVIDPKKLLTLPFSNLGQGSIPARNWVWEHSKSIGAERHWIMDDNIGGFVRLNKNQKIKVSDGTVFGVMENFVERYTNVVMAGMNYDFFAKQNQEIPPFYHNTRIYSCILLKNDADFRWRGRYNEDTDLSLRILKAGYCTILFNAFLCLKAATMTMKGGNTEELYGKTDNRREFAESLKEQHPKYVEVKKKFGRWHHQVNYKPFQRDNKLILKEGLNIPDVVNNYGMELVRVKE